MPKKILLIDYEPRSVERVRSLVTGSDYTLVEARDGEEGLNVFSASRYDAVLLAGMLPRLPTAEVIREIRRKGGAIAPPILLMVSGYKGSNRKADAQRVGAFDLLAKPFSDDDFRQALQAAIESTEIGAKTLRIPTADVAGAAASLTASDIFSDVLHEVGGELVPDSTPPPPKPAATTQEEVERRLRDTLSGILPGRAPARPLSENTPPPAPPSSKSASAPLPRFSTDADIERMISDTLSGLKSAKAPSAPAAGGPPLPRPPSPPSEKGTAGSSVSGAGPDRFGQYEILERIASGGMAELYKARRSGVEGFQKIVAIKKILPHLADNEEFIGMFADEAKLAAQLNHPNIVHIFDLGKIESGGYFIAMEFVEGRDLRTILKSAREVETPIPIPLAVYIACKVASALDYAHRRREADGRELKIVHRDVSPQNILISYEGDIKLCDFGIAKAASKVSKTESGALKGKVRYMSPEQAWGKPIDRRSDLFSLGSVLYEMLTGETLFGGDTDLNVLEKVRAAEVSPPSSMNPEVSRNLDSIVAKALAREPEARYANASDMLRDLEAVLYAHTPAPGSADLAIYLHRLQAEEAAAQESRAREAARTVVQEPEPEPRRKSKGVAVARRDTGSGPTPAASTPEAPAPGPAPKKEVTAPRVFGAFSSRPADAERRNRMPLYLLIAAAGVALLVVAYLVSRKSGVSAAAPVARATALPTEQPAPATLPTVAPAVAQAPPLNPKAVEEEVQRQLAAKKKELQRALDAANKPRETSIASARKETTPPAEQPTAGAVADAAEPVPIRSEPTPLPTAVVEIVPTSVPPPRTAPPPREPDVVRGDLVGPGPGVVEPTLVGPPKVVYPPIARQQRVTGKVIVLVLVDQDGSVADVRLQQGISSRTGVNEAVVEGVRSARFRPATKNGVPVKMWRTVVVEVKP